VLQEQERDLTDGKPNSFRTGRTNSGACQFSVLRIRYGPIASTSMRVRLKQSIASSGAQTIGSFSLKLVFRITGTRFYARRSGSDRSTTDFSLG
jgi:hypothetical protein